MSVPKIFRAESKDRTMVVIPLVGVSSLAEEHVRPELDELLEQLGRSEVTHVVMDFEKVTYFGTTMLEAMHAIWRRIRQRDGKLVLCNLSNMEREVLHVSGFDALWPMCGSREEALGQIGQHVRGGA